jgi:hypothetical protein
MKTRNVISQRRSGTLLELSEEIPRARDTTSYWTLATEVLSRNDKDIPFVLLYAADAGEMDSASSKSRFSEDHQQCTLRGSFGVPKPFAAAPDHLDLRQENGFAPYFRMAMAARKPITVSFEEGSPAAKLVQDVDWRGWVSFALLALLQDLLMNVGRSLPGCSHMSFKPDIVQRQHTWFHGDWSQSA